MKKEEFKRLKEVNKIANPIISGDILFSKRDRTLLYGYTCNRRTFHVYIKDTRIHAITYDVNYQNGINHPKAIDIVKIVVADNQNYIPDKRLYPEHVIMSSVIDSKVWGMICHLRHG